MAHNKKAWKTEGEAYVQEWTTNLVKLLKEEDYTKNVKTVASKLNYPGLLMLVT